jgi:hypothetical protein
MERIKKIISALHSLKEQRGPKFQSRPCLQTTVIPFKSFLPVNSAITLQGIGWLKSNNDMFLFLFSEKQSSME